MRCKTPISELPNENPLFLRPLPLRARKATKCKLYGARSNQDLDYHPPPSHVRPWAFPNSRPDMVDGGRTKEATQSKLISRHTQSCGICKRRFDPNIKSHSSVGPTGLLWGCEENVRVSVFPGLLRICIWPSAMGGIGGEEMRICKF